MDPPKVSKTWVEVSEVSGGSLLSAFGLAPRASCLVPRAWDMVPGRGFEPLCLAAAEFKLGKPLPAPSQPLTLRHLHVHYPRHPLTPTQPLSGPSRKPRRQFAGKSRAIHAPQLRPSPEGLRGAPPRQPASRPHPSPPAARPLRATAGTVVTPSPSAPGATVTPWSAAAGRITPPVALLPRPSRATGSVVRWPASNRHHRRANLARRPLAGRSRRHGVNAASVRRATTTPSFPGRTPQCAAAAAGDGRAGPAS